MKTVTSVCTRPLVPTIQVACSSTIKTICKYIQQSHNISLAYFISLMCVCVCLVLSEKVEIDSQTTTNRTRSTPISRQTCKRINSTYRTSCSRIKSTRSRLRSWLAWNSRTHARKTTLVRTSNLNSRFSPQRTSQVHRMEVISLVRYQLFSSKTQIESTPLDAESMILTVFNPF